MSRPCVVRGWPCAEPYHRACELPGDDGHPLGVSVVVYAVAPNRARSVLASSRMYETGSTAANEAFLQPVSADAARADVRPDVVAVQR